MITTEERRGEDPVFHQFSHDSGAYLNFYPKNKCNSWQMAEQNLPNIPGYGYGETPEQAVEDAIRVWQDLMPKIAGIINNLERFRKELELMRRMDGTFVRYDDLEKSEAPNCVQQSEPQKNQDNIK